MKIKEIINNVFHINFVSRKKLCSTFLRFQEYFESPKFKGKIFTLDKYKKWYIANSPKGKKTGKFTYYRDWTGFNIPSEILEPFYQGKFDPLSKKEKKLLDLFKEKRGKKFYIIATFSHPTKKALRHEIAHGLFYTNPKYKREILKALKKIGQNKIKKIHKCLSKLGGYHSDVWVDETQAYLIDGLSKLKKHGLDISDLKDTSKKFNSILDKYIG